MSEMKRMIGVTFPEVRCPECGSDADVYICDRGIKFAYRYVFRNNRFMCRECMVTWRRKHPEAFLKLNEIQSNQQNK